MQSLPTYLLLFLFLYSGSIYAAEGSCYSVNNVQSIRPNKTIRLGGYFYTGRLDKFWYANNFDLLDLNAKNDPNLVKSLRLFNPKIKIFQQFLTNQIAIKQTGAQAIDGFDSTKMDSWLLRDANGSLVHPRGPNYLMMKMSPQTDWPSYFASRAKDTINFTAADGVVLDEVPLRKSGMFNSFTDSMTSTLWRQETLSFLKTLRNNLKMPVLINAGELSSLDENGQPLWKTFSQTIDGAWHEGWVRYYGAHNSPHTGDSWEWDIRSAEEFSATGKYYIASPAFSNRAELEYAVANYLLAVNGDSLVFQPMVAYNSTTRGGFNFEVAQKAVKDNLDLFDVELGCALDKRKKNGDLWLRQFQYGISIVNPTNKAVSLSNSIKGIFYDTRGVEIKLPQYLQPFEGLVLYNQNKFN